eukprot:Hpha_TRINITY_DN15871_c1_g15::TRINITY_DN15871_c1_g15_i1::g.187802::m.187802
MVLDGWQVAADRELYGVAAWGERVRGEKNPVDNPYNSQTALRLGEKGVYEARDCAERWWPVTITDIHDDGTYKAVVHDSQERAWPVVYSENVRRIKPPDQIIDDRRRKRCTKCSGSGKTRWMLLGQATCPSCNGNGIEVHRFQVGDTAEVLRSTGSWVNCTIIKVESQRYVVEYAVDGPNGSRSQKAVPRMDFDVLRSRNPRTLQYDGLGDFCIGSKVGEAPGVVVFTATTRYAQVTVLLYVVPDVFVAEGKAAQARLRASGRFTDGRVITGAGSKYVLSTYAEFLDYAEGLPLHVWPRPLSAATKDKACVFVTVAECCIPGENLESLLEKRRKFGVSPLVSESKAIRILHQLLLACVAWQRAGVAHRQVVPENVIISNRTAGEAQTVKGRQGVYADALSNDFVVKVKGFADAVMNKPQPPPAAAARGNSRKTPEREPPGPQPLPPLVFACKAAPLPSNAMCLPPEVVSAHQRAGMLDDDSAACIDYTAADIFSIGLVLYDVLSPDGADPWGREKGVAEGCTDAKYRDLPSAGRLGTIVRKMLHARPADRPAAANLESEVRGLSTELASREGWCEHGGEHGERSGSEGK